MQNWRIKLDGVDGLAAIGLQVGLSERFREGLKMKIFIEEDNRQENGILNSAWRERYGKFLVFFLEFYFHECFSNLDLQKNMSVEWKRMAFFWKCIIFSTDSLIILGWVANIRTGWGWQTRATSSAEAPYSNASVASAIISPAFCKWNLNFLRIPIFVSSPLQ